jgi:hypothetical protein
LTLELGELVSEATGQQSLSLTLTNRTEIGCFLYGYPGVSLLDSSGRLLPLNYRWSGDQMITSNKPTHVDVRPRSAAYVTINKYRCDLGNVAHATLLRVIPPDDTNRLELELPADSRSLDYCGTGDPGSDLHISPVEPTFPATLLH